MKTWMTTDVSCLSDLQVPYEQVNRLHIDYLKFYEQKIASILKKSVN